MSVIVTGKAKPQGFNNTLIYKAKGGCHYFSKLRLSPIVLNIVFRLLKLIKFKV